MPAGGRRVPRYVIGTDNSIFEDVPVEHFLTYHRAWQTRVSQ